MDQWRGQVRRRGRGSRTLGNADQSSETHICKSLNVFEGFKRGASSLHLEFGIWDLRSHMHGDTMDCTIRELTL
jgi:hypothetical protein